ncbi:MAG: GNAT family N-acetyltransferase [Actinophytocola sp.]|nr:GNAT family N-acetyltransferase [Actinophytocola sp.]
MTDREIRLLKPTELREANALFRGTLHGPPPSDEDWERVQHAYQPERSWGAFADGSVIGLARSVDSALTVPGDAQVELAAVTAVGVRSDRTRRGVLTELMRAQLTEFAERGVPVAALHASEAVIYGRFGYGVATLERSIRLDRRRATVHNGAAGGDEIELHALDDAVRLLPEIYAPFAAGRAGMVARPSYLWPGWEGHYRRSNGAMRLAVHRGRDGVDGYAAYRVHNPWPEEGDCVLYVEDMNVANPDAFAGLWRYLLSVDLVDRIDAFGRPVDEPVAALLTDQRACETRGVYDDVWVRLVDVPAALSARTYRGSGSVVIDVRDTILTSNSGSYRLSADGCARTDEPAALSMTVDTLAMLYLGGWQASALVTAGRIEATDAESVAIADRLFAADVAPWCGTPF